MSLRRRIPLVALQRAVFKVLQDHPISINNRVVPVFDDIPRDPGALPWITFGSFTHSSGAGKITDMGESTLHIHIWSDYHGKKEVNEIADDLALILTSVPLCFPDGGFVTATQDVTFFEAFEADNDGYHGVLTFSAKIQNIGG